MKLMTKTIARTLPAIGSHDGLGMDAVARVKFFNPCGAGTWYATEFDGRDMMFGLASITEAELGYFSLAELEAIRLPFGLKIERDLHFQPTRLSDLMNDN